MQLTTNQLDSERLEKIASKLAELGHPTRLAIFMHLVKAGEKGAAVGEIQQILNIPGSTLSHHIAKMVKVDLIKQIRESRTLYCIPQYDTLVEIVNFLQEECCVNSCC